MEYTDTILDRKTGELITVDAGDWITLTELGDRYSVSRIKVRTVLRNMGFLYVAGGRAHNRHHLMPWVIAQGLGKHVPAKRKGQYPFDVVGPEGQAWIAARWSDAVEKISAEQVRPALIEAIQALQAFKDDRGRHDLNIHGSVLWIADYYPAFTHTEIACVLGVTQQLVSRYLSIRSKQLKAARLRLSKPLDAVVKVHTYVDRPSDLMPPMSSGGARSITYVHNMLENVPATNLKHDNGGGAPRGVACRQPGAVY